MDKFDRRTRRPGGSSIVLVTIVSMAVIAAVVLAVGRGRFFSTSDADTGIADAYQGRVVVGWYPIPGVLPAQSGSASSDPFSVANALTVLVGTTPATPSGENELEQIQVDLQAQLVAFFDSETGNWSGSAVPEEVMTSTATQALAAAGTWPATVDSTLVIERSEDTLRTFLATADTSDPLLAADLLPWAQIAAALPVEAELSARLVELLPVEAACQSAVLSEPVEGLALTPALLTAIELSLLTGNEQCLGELAATIDVNLDTLGEAIDGSDAIFHMRAAYDLEQIGLIPSAAADAMITRGADNIATESSVTIIPQIEDLAGLVNAGLVAIRLPDGIHHSALAQYAQGNLNAVPERNAGLYLLIDGILGEYLPDTRQELLSWVEPTAADLTDHERLVIAALGLGDLPPAMPSLDELDGTSEVALLIAYARYGTATCPLLEAWPEQPTGALAVAIRNLAIDCGSSLAPLGPDMATFIGDAVTSRPWTEGEQLLQAIQLTRGVAAACLSGIEIGAVTDLGEALGQADAIIAEGTPPGTSEFADWSRAIATSYSNDDCKGVLRALVPQSN